jgi:hypothetical protein
MKRTNIHAVLEMVHRYLDGQIDRTELILDFPYELEKRYAKMRSEDSEYAKLIYDRLLEAGVYRADRLPDEEFRDLIRRQYEDVLDIANGGFM